MNETIFYGEEMTIHVERMLPYIMAADERQLMAMPIGDLCQVLNVRRVWANFLLAQAVRNEAMALPRDPGAVA